MCLRIVRSEVDSTFEAVDRLSSLLQPDKRVAQVVMCDRKVRFEVDGEAIACCRLVQSSELCERDAEVEVCLREMRLEFDSAAEAINCLRQPVQSNKYIAQIGMIFGDPGIDRNCPRDHVNGQIRLPKLVSNHPEHVSAVGMAGVDRQNLLIEARSFVQASCPMLADAIGEQALRCVYALLSFRPALFAVHVPVA